MDAIAEWYGSLPDAYYARRKSMPPLLILHGQLDTVIPVQNAEQLLRLCRMDRLQCEAHIYPGMEHGLIGSTPGTSAVADADERTLTFLSQRFSIAADR